MWYTGGRGSGEWLLDLNKLMEDKMTRSEHLQWCKDRAMEYVDRGDVTNAYSSMCSDLDKHVETKNHPAISLGMGLMVGGMLSTVEEMRKFIEGFN